jgi:hypothetical protein
MWIIGLVRSLLPASAWRAAGAAGTKGILSDSGQDDNDISAEYLSGPGCKEELADWKKRKGER